ncbi:hypothetical protein B1400_1528 [Bifidobacterium italicum]|uniref:Uncharacterized protein n=1 Tax=Bifidobacterium italicum TaxID=1960968 RepID=A0A2A2EG16_9BIFI|nr:hypothetical protein [Bifidobacterium italicum]PAU67845.1 hypothetical protein B1400_1528 [Bifidobacterium italicum]
MHDLVRNLRRGLSKFVRPSLRTTIVYLLVYAIVCLTWWMCLKHGVLASVFPMITDPRESIELIIRTSLWILVPLLFVPMLVALYAEPWTHDDCFGAALFGFVAGLACVFWSMLDLWSSIRMLEDFDQTAGAIIVCTVLLMLRLAWKTDDLRDTVREEEAQVAKTLSADDRLRLAHAALFNNGWEQLGNRDRLRGLRALSRAESTHFGMKGRVFVVEEPLVFHGVMWEYIDGGYLITVDAIRDDDDRTDLALVVVTLTAFSYLHASGNGLEPPIEDDDAPQQVGELDILRRGWHSAHDVIAMLEREEDVDGELGIAPLCDVALRRALQYATHELTQISAYGRP